MSEIEKGPVRAYIDEISKTPVLSDEEEAKLAKRVAEKDQEARKQLIQANLRLVVFFAKRYIKRLRKQRLNLSLMELIQEGNVGLLIAVDRRPWREGHRFSAYAASWIKYRIGRAVWRAIADRQKRTASLFKLFGDDDSTFADFIEDKSAATPDDIVAEEMKDDAVTKTIREAVAGLDKRSCKIISMLFGLDGNNPHTLRAVAEEFGVKKESIWKTKKRDFKLMLLTRRVQLLRQHYDVL